MADKNDETPCDRDIDKKWKYLYFPQNGFPGTWDLDCSDERPPISSHYDLLSAEQVNGKLMRDENFLMVFNAVAHDPQLIQCSNGLYVANYYIGFRISGWRIFPCFFNRHTWQQFSRLCRSRRRIGRKIISSDIDWMNNCQLRLAKKLSKEVLGISDTAGIDNLLSEGRVWSQ